MSTTITPYADAARSVLRTTFGPRVPVPVDPVVVARTLGINVWLAKMENGISGFISKRRGEDEEAEIFVNSEQASVRQRFTIAHEVGHFLRHVERYGSDAPMYYKRDALAACGTHADEIYANGFAACLLMPEEQVRQYARVESELKMSRRFEVSLLAMSNRLDNLHITAA